MGAGAWQCCCTLHTFTVTGSIVALLYFYVRLQESSVLIYIYTYIIPVVPHKAVAEVSKIGSL